MSRRYTVSPEQQLLNIADSLAYHEAALEAAGLPVYHLQQWLTLSLTLTDLRARHARGELRPLVIDPEETTA